MIYRGEAGKVDLIDETFSHSANLFNSTPDLLPTLGTISLDEMNSYMDRLFVPNIEVLSQREVRLTTPPSLKGKELLGVVALNPGQTVYLDEELVTPATSQQEYIASYLESHEAFTGDPAQAVSKVIDVMRNFMPYVAITNPDYANARTVSQGITTAMLKSSLPGLSGENTHQIMAKPLMILSADQSYKRVSPSIVAHESDHAVETLQGGIRGSYGSLPERHRLRSELRGYHVSDHVVRKLVEINYDSSQDGSNIGETSRIVESLRTAHASNDDPFSPSDDILSAIRSQNYGLILDQ
jgi:hypothetical protein